MKSRLVRIFFTHILYKNGTIIKNRLSLRHLVFSVTNSKTEHDHREIWCWVIETHKFWKLTFSTVGRIIMLKFTRIKESLISTEHKKHRSLYGLLYLEDKSKLKNNVERSFFNARMLTSVYRVSFIFEIETRFVPKPTVRLGTAVKISREQ